jgi:sugar phosphate isomerase/epimerase
VDRREFIAQSGLGVLGVPGLFRRPKTFGPIGIQLYTLRREMRRDFEGTLMALGEIGYREVEFAGYFGKSPAEVRAILAKARLTAPASHVGDAGDLSKDWEKAVDTAREVGHTWVVVPSINSSLRKTVDDCKRLGDLFNRAAETAKRAGLSFAYHNHDFEFKPIDGVLPYDIFLQHTDPALVKFELDLFWIRRGGQDALAYFAKWPGRFPLVHVKDMDASNTMVDVGAGTIDFKAIFAKRTQAGIQHYFVEHDDPKPDGLASAKASYAFLSRMTL